MTLVFNVGVYFLKVSLCALIQTSLKPAFWYWIAVLIEIIIEHVDLPRRIEFLDRLTAIGTSLHDEKPDHPHASNQPFRTEKNNHKTQWVINIILYVIVLYTTQTFGDRGDVQYALNELFPLGCGNLIQNVWVVQSIFVQLVRFTQFYQFHSHVWCRL